MLPPKRDGRGPADAGRPGRRRAAQGRRGRGAGGDRGADRLLRASTAGAAERSTRAWARRRVYEPQPATVTLSGTPVAFPVGALPPGDRGWRGGAGRGGARGGRRARSAIADLFAGLGTFALALPAQVYAAEASRDAAAGAEARRAGDARSSTATSIAGRSMRPSWRASTRSCSIRRAPARPSRSRRLPRQRCRASPTSAATRRPSRATPKMLVDGGYALDWVKPVGQFRWSTHVELAAAFSR